MKLAIYISTESVKDIDNLQKISQALAKKRLNKPELEKVVREIIQSMNEDDHK